MFSRLILYKVKIAIFVALLLVVVLIGYFFFKGEDKFDIISIQQKLTSGNSALFQSDIKWIEEDGKLIGDLKIEKLKSNVTYILQNRSIETISFVEKTNDFQDKIPCLNLVHLLSRSEVKNFYEVALKDPNSTTEGYQIPINKKIFIDYYQTIVPKGLELHCKMYYID